MKEGRISAPYVLDGNGTSTPAPVQISSFWFSRALLLIAASLLAVTLWIAWCEYPLYWWNDMRLAPAFAVREGINPYPGLDEGPLSTWIYGPVGIVVNLPATFATNALSSIRAAAVINALVVIGPLAIILLRSREMRARGRLEVMLGLTLAIILLPPRNLVIQAADNCTIAFGLLSLWCLTSDHNPSHRKLALAATFAALSVWSKQIAVFMVIAELGYLWLQSGFRKCAAYTAWLAVAGFSALGVFSWAFGFSNLRVNLVSIPARLPWADLGPRLALHSWSLVGLVVVPAVTLILVWLGGKWPSRDSESGRFLQITVLAALAMLPVGVAGLFKIGGDTNMVHSWNYVLPGLILFLFVRLDSRTAFRQCILGTAVVLGALLHGSHIRAITFEPLTANFKIADELAAAHPARLWFPQNPVLTYYATGKLWHCEDGLLTRSEAGYALKESNFKRHVPPSLEGIAYPSNVDSHPVTSLLPEFNRITKYPYWVVLTKIPNAAPP